MLQSLLALDSLSSFCDHGQNYEEADERYILKRGIENKNDIAGTCFFCGIIASIKYRSERAFSMARESETKTPSRSIMSFNIRGVIGDLVAHEGVVEPEPMKGGMIPKLVASSLVFKLSFVSNSSAKLLNTASAFFSRSLPILSWDSLFLSK